MKVLLRCAWGLGVTKPVSVSGHLKSLPAGVLDELALGLPRPHAAARRTHMAISNCSIHLRFISSVLQKNWKPCFPWR